jgi:hypothetical protein
MGLGRAAVQLTLELWQRGFFKNINSVIDMGSQELHVTQNHFERMVEAAAVPNYQRANFPGIENWPGGPRSSARPFYQMLGAENYACIDLNKAFGAVAHDLNVPFTDPAHLGKYDLVTDHGTCEHAFNIAESYRTLHRLCRAKGLIMVIQQVYGGNGYYNFDPSFFEGLAAANGYKILFASHVVSLPNSELEFHVPIAEAMLEVIDWGKVGYLGMAYVFQKQNDDEFQMPYEGPYEDNYGYNIQWSLEVPSRAFVPVFNLDAVNTRALIKALSQRLRPSTRGLFKRLKFRLLREFRR